MHIPDSFLDARTALVTAALAAAGLGVALRQARRHLPPKRVPLLGLCAAFVFAAQIINFPVVGGVSGHLVGGLLTAVLLGPSAAVVVIAAVLIVQALLFADGGITALGANILNMALVGSVGGYGVYRLLGGGRWGLRGRLVAAMVAAWASVVLAAVACAGELAMSGLVSPGRVLPIMAGIHMLIGLGEALITALVLAAVARTRPELTTPADRAVRFGPAIAYGLIVCLGLAVFVSPFACRWDDGLEWAARRLGFAQANEGARPVMPAPAADYRAPGIGSSLLATSVAGGVGTLVVFGLALGVSRSLTRRAPEAEPTTRSS